MMNMDKSCFGNFIAQQRRQLGMTQRELAEQLHVTNRAVSKWERGCSYPDVTLSDAVWIGGGHHLKLSYSYQGTDGLGRSSILVYDADTGVVSLT